MLPDGMGVIKMVVKRRRKAARVTRKTVHGDTTRAVGLKSRGLALRSVYRRLEKSPVLFPISKTDTSSRILAASVKAVVDPKK